MKLTGLGKLMMLILAAGLAVGGWRAWQGMQGKGGGGFKMPGLKLPGSNGSKGATDSGPVSTEGGSGDIKFVITAAKKDWVQDQVDRFNAANQGKWHIVTEPVPSREAMHKILSGQIKPVLWSPGSPIWPARLAEAWQASSGASILDMSDPNGYRVFLRSPLVFVTTKKKAEFLRPLLGGPKPWAALRELSLRKRKTPWGRFTFSHADPLTSSSGMLTLGLILFDYGQQTGQSGQLVQVTKDKKFMAYVQELEASLIYDAPAEKGTTALTKAFLEDPSRYDLITAYESAALEAAPRDPNLAVIYPNPTAVSEHAVSLLSGSWVTPQQRAGAEAFLTFLGSKESLQAGLKYHFRPAQASGTLTLAPELARLAGQGFQQSYSSIDLPPYEALNSAAFQWRLNVAHKPAS